jgi:hypothetical protein
MLVVVLSSSSMCSPRLPVRLKVGRRHGRVSVA